MVKQELLAVDERPHNIFVCLALAGQRAFVVRAGCLFGDVLCGQLGFFGLRQSGIGRKVELVDFFLIAPFGVSRQRCGDALVIGEFLLDFPGIEQMEALGEAGVLRALALAGAEESGRPKTVRK